MHRSHFDSVIEETDSLAQAAESHLFLKSVVKWKL